MTNSKIFFKLTIADKACQIPYLERKEKLQSFVAELLNDKEKAIKEYITNTIQNIKNHLQNFTSKEFGMTKEQIENQVELINDCFYNNIISKESFGSQLSVDGKKKCYADILDGLLIVLLHLKVREM